MIKPLRCARGVACAAVAGIDHGAAPQGDAASRQRPLLIGFAG